MNTIEKQIREHHQNHSSLDERITAEIRKAMGEVPEKDQAEFQEFMSRYTALVKAAYLEETKKEAAEQDKKTQTPTVVYEKFRPFITSVYTLFLTMLLIPVGIISSMVVTLFPLLMFLYLLNRSRYPLLILSTKTLLLDDYKSPIPWGSIQDVKVRMSGGGSSIYIKLSLKEEWDLPWISSYGRIIHYRKKRQVWIHSNALQGLNGWDLERLFTQYRSNANTQNQYLG